MRERINRLRNLIAMKLCNFLLIYVATDWYSTRIGDYIERGIIVTHTGILREIQADAWDEGSEQTSEWMWNNPTPSGVPVDPPLNPYERP